MASSSSASPSSNGTSTRSDPFKRLVWLDMRTRQKQSRDKRLGIKRAGYDAHDRSDSYFWKSKTASGQTTAPSYTEPRFCEEFDITAMEFYIVRRRLVTLLYRENLYLKLRKVDKKTVSDVDFDYQDVEDKIAGHHLLGGHQVHAYWKRPMIADFVTKTAEWMRQKKKSVLDAAGSEVPGQFKIRPNYTLISPGWTWGGAVLNLKYDKEVYASFERLKITLRSWNARKSHGATTRFSELVHIGTDLDIENVRFELLLAEVTRCFPAVAGKEKEHVLAYLNPYWGNELLPVEDDKSLVVAINTLRIRGFSTMPFYLLSVEESSEDNDIVDADEDEDEDSGSEASSAASWKSDGYYTDGGLERIARKAQTENRKQMIESGVIEG